MIESMNGTAPLGTNHESRPPATGLPHQLAVRIAAVAGVFSLLVCLLLLYDYSRRKVEDPLESVEYTTWKGLLAKQPDNRELRQAIRKVDEQARDEYFWHRGFAATGAGLLVGGLAVFLIAAKTAVTLRRILPRPEPAATPVDTEAGWTRIGRWSVGGLAVVLICGSVGLWFGLGTELPRDRQGLADLLKAEQGEPPVPSDDDGAHADAPLDETPVKVSIEPYPAPTEEEIRKAWPRFRGLGGAGVSAYDNTPDAWNGTSGEGVLWKTPVPLPGKNSPVVWANRVFLSGADENRRQVFCFDTADGKLLWKKNVPGTPESMGEMPEPEFTGYAAPTCTTDGRLVFAGFANGDLCAFDYRGNLAWNRSLGIPENGYGHAASLAMYRELLLVQFDQGNTGKKKMSRFYALDNVSGQTKWEVTREVPNSWTSPIVINHDGRDQVITCADPWVIAYDPADGKELWKAKVLSGDCGPSPVYAGGLVHVGNEYCTWSAIRPDGEGDVTGTEHVAWSAEDGLPDTCSPLATEEFVFLMPSTGYFTCLDAKTGEMLWEYEFEDDTFTSSPSLAGSRIYLFSDEGKTTILEPSREECKKAGQAELGEACVTSPAFQDGRIYIRGEKHLFCIGGK